jgi:hypothetical protein
VAAWGSIDQPYGNETMPKRGATNLR